MVVASLGPNHRVRRRRWGCLALLAASLLAPPRARAQVLPSGVRETVVVTATLSPEEESQVGSAVTVITRDDIERSGARTVLEALRLVPGLDVVRSGGDGAITSVFLRGAGSGHTLVLVDGVRVNPVYFPGFDFGQWTTESVERIEVVRGPYSPLYGSDAIGGVIQIFTRGGGGGAPAGSIALEGGDRGQRQGTLFGSAGSGALSATASYRDARADGERSNSDWRQRNGFLRLDLLPGRSVGAAVEASILDGEIGVPGPVGAETPRARSAMREERLALPVAFDPAPRHTTRLLLARTSSVLSFEDPDAGFASTTRSTTWQARLSNTWSTDRQSLTAFLAWELWDVSPEDTFGTTLSNDRVRTWGAGVQESVRAGGRWAVTFGGRLDRHGTFGSAASPRVTAAWLSADSRWKVRLSAGRAFRAPALGELFFPFAGNPGLDPERSTSYEAGFERYVPGGRLEATVFWNRIRDLIVFDFASFRNENVGRARAWGVEVGLRQQVHRKVHLEAGYTWLDAEDGATGQPLLRRPRHRAFAAAAVRPVAPLSLTVRGTFSGRRRDVDPLTFESIEAPSHVRYDLFARYEARPLSPYLRVENAGDRRYEEAKGFPAPRRRYAVGFEWRPGAGR